MSDPEDSPEIPGGVLSGQLAAVPRTLPRGSHALGREVVLLSQRARLVEAIVQLVASKGYAAVRVRDITTHARVSRTTFYEQFTDKEGCFLAAYRAGAHAHVEHVTAAIRRRLAPAEQIAAAIVAYVEVLVAEPDYAWTFLVEVHRAGEPALEERVKILGRYADLLRSWYDAHQTELDLTANLPAGVYSAAVAAVDALVAEAVRERRLDRLPALVPTLVYIQLALMGAPDLAAALVEHPG
jgi:AcrR family transcriptional regulator